MINALPFRLISDGDREAFVSNLAALNDWSKNWFAIEAHWAAEAFSEEKISAFTQEKSHWVVWGKSPDEWVAWKYDNVLIRDLLGMMFNRPIGSSVKPTVLMKEIMDECVNDFVHEIFKICGLPQPGQPNAALFESLRINHGSGAMLSELQEGFSRQQIALGGDLVERIIGKRPSPELQQSLTPRKAAIGRYETHLEVIAGSAELTLQDLSNLEIGDVIRLDKVIHDNFSVRLADTSLAKVNLGLQGNHKAIQLVEDN